MGSSKRFKRRKEGREMKRVGGEERKGKGKEKEESGIDPHRKMAFTNEH